MKRDTLESVITLHNVAIDAMAEVMQQPADGLSIGNAMAIGNTTHNSLKRLARQVEWLRALQLAHETTLS